MKTKEIKLFKYIRNGLIFSLFAGLVACGGETETAVESEVLEEDIEEVGDVATWDNDNFNSTFASNNYYEEWDANDDELLDENEFNDSFFGLWDENDDELIDDAEWQTSANNFGIENEDWRDWDANADNQLDENEFRTGMADNTYRTEWDADKDNMINEREYTDGVFGLWDENDDNVLDDAEYNENYNRYFGTEESM